MDVPVCDACANEIEEMTVAEQDANNHLNYLVYFLFIDCMLLEPCHIPVT
jgi:hypothetical protein